MTVNAWTRGKPYPDAEDGPCPEWCTEHYVTPRGARNHSSTPLAITGGGARTAAALTVSTWVERRDWPDGTTDTVGILGQLPEDIELSAGQMRDFAQHLLTVADEVDRLATVAVEAYTGSAGQAQVTVTTPEDDREITLAVRTPKDADRVYLSPAGARQLGAALMAAGRQPGRPGRMG
ncbi:hypothetical protein [Actinoplanes sp. NPDC026670]|uniref:DUF6907 domain-containing protein n=1 Tax=Actinoplanes sp. NPDC026670 TaxID=3154700 RepID=UPI0033F60AFB